MSTESAASSADAIYASVRNYYGKVLQNSSDLKTSACCTSVSPPKPILDILSKVPDEIKEKYYGCGTPLPAGIEGLDVLDLGSGSGRDCYVAAAMVGSSGSVTGIDMTEQQLSVARAHVPGYTSLLGYSKPNLHFKHGYIEFLEKAGVQAESVDLVISNCVLNLSPNKAQVLQEVYRALRPGGEFYFSDVYASRRLPKEVQTHPVLLGECIGGALYIEDFKRLCHQVGFADPRILSQTPFEIFDEELKDLVGEARFFSITYRLFKLPGRLETICENYGQVAYYHGTIPGHKHRFQLDDHHVLETGKPLLVCGNTASMLGESWLKKHFRIEGDRRVHYGPFDCSSGPSPTPETGGGSCC